MAEHQSRLFKECEHLRTHMVLMHQGPHYAKLLCSDCETFLRWEPKPESVMRQHRNTEILTALSKLSNLPSWERQFVRDLATHKHISPKQQLKLLELADLLLPKDSGKPPF